MISGAALANAGIAQRPRRGFLPRGGCAPAISSRGKGSANQGFFWWEIDISYYVLKTLSLFGLVWDIRKASHKVKAKPEALVGGQ